MGLVYTGKGLERQVLQEHDVRIVRVPAPFVWAGTSILYNLGIGLMTTEQQEI
jgi:hypothetical protein